MVETEEDGEDRCPREVWKGRFSEVLRVGERRLVGMMAQGEGVLVEVAR